MPARIIKFDNNNWVTVPEGVLKDHPGFLACWEGQATLNLPDIPYHVAHVLLHYLYIREYQNLKTHGAYQERCANDFCTAIYVYKIGIKYQLPELEKLAAAKIRSYGDKIAFMEIIKRMSSPPFSNMEIKGLLNDYLCARMTREGASMTSQTRAEIEKVMESTMISILYQRIVGLEREKGKLQEAVHSLQQKQTKGSSRNKSR